MGLGATGLTGIIRTGGDNCNLQSRVNEEKQSVQAVKQKIVSLIKTINICTDTNTVRSNTGKNCMNRSTLIPSNLDSRDSLIIGMGIANNLQNQFDSLN